MLHFIFTSSATTITDNSSVTVNGSVCFRVAGGLNIPPPISLSRCPKFSSADLTRYGKRNGNQIWLCKPCRTRFTENGAQPGRKVPPKQVGSAVSLFYDGLSTEDVRRNFGTMFDFQPSTASVYEWIRDYSNLAETKLRETRPTKLGNTWVADEMVVRAGGEKLWIWTVMDGRSRFILASHVSKTRSLTEARKVFREAKRNAGGCEPLAVITDGLPAYLRAIDDTFGMRTRHSVSGSVAGSPNNNLIERLNGTIRERTKVLRGMKSRKTTEELLEGWTVHYNYFRPHESLRDRPPAKVAGVDYTLASWEDVAGLDLRPISHHRSPTERERQTKRLGTELNRATRRVSRRTPKSVGFEEYPVPFRPRRQNKDLLSRSK